MHYKGIYKILQTATVDNFVVSYIRVLIVVFCLHIKVIMLSILESLLHLIIM